MKWILAIGALIILLILFVVLTLKRPDGDAATSVTPTPVPNKISEDDWNRDGMVDERDAALHEER